jgi:chromosome segregation ATPase
MEEHCRTQKHQETIMKVVVKMENDLSPATTAITNDPTIAQLQEVYDTLNILSGGIEALNDDGQRLSNESVQSQIKIQALTEEVLHVKESVEESHIFLEGVKQNQDILNQDVSSLKDKINDMQYVSYDGSFVWKIVNFQEKMSKSAIMYCEHITYLICFI